MTFDELLAYCTKYANQILVRVKVDGKWSNITLADAPEKIKQEYMQHWIDSGVMPYRIKTQDELDNQLANRNNTIQEFKEIFDVEPKTKWRKER